MYRMWSEIYGSVRCTLDLSNRPHYEGDVTWTGEGVVDDARVGEGEVCKEMVEVRNLERGTGIFKGGF